MAWPLVQSPDTLALCALNRRDKERLRAVERKAAGEARQIISKAERAASRKRQRRRALFEDIALAVAIALVLFGLWKLAAGLALP